MERGLQRRLEGAEIAVVHADERCRERQGALELIGIVHLHQYCHAALGGELRELVHARVVERRDDEQDAVRADCARLVHLIGIDNEILAQRRQLAGGARLLQIALATLKEIGVGEHGETRRAVSRVTRRDRGGIERFAQHTQARRNQQEHGDHGSLALGYLRPQRVREVARRVSPCSPTPISFRVASAICNRRAPPACCWCCVCFFLLFFFWFLWF